MDLCFKGQILSNTRVLAPFLFKEKNPFRLVEEVYSVYRDQNTQRAWEKKFEKFEKKSRTKALKLKLTGSSWTQQGGPSIWMRNKEG